MKEFITELSRIEENKPFTAKLSNGSEIVLVRKMDKIYALSSICPHMGGPMGEGEVEGSCITCPWHGWQFDLETGTSLTMPGDDLTTYKTIIEDGKVYIVENQTPT